MAGELLKPDEFVTIDATDDAWGPLKDFLLYIDRDFSGNRKDKNSYKVFEKGPHSNPVALTRFHLKETLVRPDQEFFKKYLVGEKTDGIRYLLVRMKDDFVYLVGRFFEKEPNEIHRLTNDRGLGKHFKDTLPHESIYDCELVRDLDYTDTPLLQIFDILLARDEKNIPTNYGRRPAHARVQRMKDLSRTALQTQCDRVTFKYWQDVHSVIECLPCCGDSEFIDWRGNRYNVDGLVFMPQHRYMAEKDQTLFKWKPAEKVTVDFQVTKKDGSWHYLLGQSKDAVEVQSVSGGGRLRNLECVLPTDLPEEVQDGDVGEFKVAYNKIQDNDSFTFEFVQVRDDKKGGNGVSNFIDTLVVVKENITLEEVMCTLVDERFKVKHSETLEYKHERARAKYALKMHGLDGIDESAPPVSLDSVFDDY
jgi:hypothetical protein